MCILNCNFSVGIVASRSSIRNFSDRSYRPAVNQTINCLIEQNNAKQCKRITYKVRFNTVYPMNQKKICWLCEYGTFEHLQCIYVFPNAKCLERTSNNKTRPECYMCHSKPIIPRPLR